MDQIQRDRFLEILQKYHAGKTSPEEEDFLEAYYQAFRMYPEYTDSLPDDKFMLLRDDIKQSVMANISLHQHRNTRTARRTIIQWSAAAIMIITGAGLLYYSQNHSGNTGLVVEQVKENDISPGGNKAILTLANGQKIILTDAGNGLLAEQSGVKITKMDDGQLIYTISGDISLPSDGKVQYNTIETPKGGQYQVVLPDGSKVWLNAGSKITYPSVFVSNGERRLELKGEAYFEVARDKDHPFIVKTINQEIEVLGTQFNVNSYEDEFAVKTTLLEGSIKVVTDNGVKEVLQPGQQSVITSDRMVVNEIDPELAVAWKNNLFIFESDDIRYIMRMVARWYNVEVEYEGMIPDDKFGGSVSRFENVSEVLKPLEATGKVKFRIEDSRIIVSR
jgi:transmembrane sensor